MQKKLYPEIKPHCESTLKVDGEHTLYFAEYGNPKGIPVVVCHGGPGAGSDSYFAQYFNPTEYRVIVFDQRGAGQSTPKGSLNNNETKHHIHDIEKLREHLKIDRWAVKGGSWGATLALLYAEAHPDRVLGLILRGVFLGRDKDTTQFVTENSFAALNHSVEWKKFKEQTAGLVELAKLTVDMSDLITVFYALLNQPNKAIQSKAAVLFSWWEESISTKEPNQSEVDWSYSEDGINMGKTEITYLKNRCYLRENQILEEIKKIENIPTFIVQGNLDLVCPPYQAQELAKNLKDVTLHFSDAGHWGKEVDTINYLVQSTDALAIKLKQTLKVVQLPANYLGQFGDESMPRTGTLSNSFEHVLKK